MAHLDIRDGNHVTSYHHLQESSIKITADANMVYSYRSFDVLDVIWESVNQGHNKLIT